MPKVATSELSTVARRMARALSGIEGAQMALLDGDSHRAQSELLDANTAAQDAILTLRDNGVEDVYTYATRDVPLLELDTPDTRRLLALLAEAQEVAERVDGARGRALPSSAPLLPGEGRGVDLAESIGYLKQRLALEVHGPVGSGRE